MTGSLEWGERATIIYTLVATAKRRSVEPIAYLKDVLTCLPDYAYKKPLICSHKIGNPEVNLFSISVQDRFTEGIPLPQNKMRP